MQGDVDNTDLAPDALSLLTEEQTDRLSAVLDDYLARLEAGDAVDKSQLLERNPDIAEALKLYLGKLGELHNFAAGFSPHLAGVDAEEDLASEPWLSDSSENASDTNHGLNDSTHVPPLLDEVGTAGVSTKVLSGDLEEAEFSTVGRKLDDFQLLRVIGRGGMGIVYEAEQISLKRRVALKLLPLISVLDARQITRFKNEAQAAASLQHPHIVPVYAVGNYRGVHYYAMRFIDGHPLDAIIESLRAWRQKNSSEGTKAEDNADETLAQEAQWTVPPAYQRVVKIGLQAAGALAAAHEEGIIHRDIKPSNLMIDKKNKLWITDFGLARRMTDHSLTATGDVVGTLRYMSPEQARGQTALVDGRSDVYSLGVTLYELLTLEPAIAGDNSPALLRAIDTTKPQSLRQLRPDVPRDLATVIEKAMSKSREDRYLTAQELSEDLTRVLEGRPTLAQPPSLMIRGIKWVQRNQATARLVAAIGTISLLFLSVALWILSASRIESASARREMEHQANLLATVKEAVGEIEKEANLIPGTSRLRKQMIDGLLLRLYRDFTDSQRKQPQARSQLATSLIEMGLLYAKVRRYEEAHSALQEARQLAKALSIEAPSKIERRSELARATDALSQVALAQHDHQTSLTLAQEAVRLQHELTEINPDNHALQLNLAAFANHLAFVQIKLDMNQEAFTGLEQVRRQLEPLLPALSTDDALQMRIQLAAICTKLGHLLQSSQIERSIEQYEKAVDHNLAVAKAQNSRIIENELAISYSNLAKALSSANRIDEAANQYAAMVSLSELLVEVDPESEEFKRTLAGGLNNLGMTRLRQRQKNLGPTNSQQDVSLTDALSQLTRAIQLQRDLVQKHPQDAQLCHELGGMYNNLASIQTAANRAESVESAYQMAVQYQDQAIQLAPDVTGHRNFQDTHLLNYAKWLLGQGRYEATLEVMQKRRQLWPPADRRQLEIARDLAGLAIELTKGNAPSAVVQRFAQLSKESIDMAQDAGLDVQSVITEEPFSSLNRLKLMERARP